MRCGHRDDTFRVGCRRFLEGHHGDRAHVSTTSQATGLHHFKGHYSRQTMSRARYLLVSSFVVDWNDAQESIVSSQGAKRADADWGDCIVMAQR